MIDEYSGSVISLNEAQSYVKAFKDRYPDEARAFFVGRNHVEAILAQKDCIGIRIYNGFETKDNRMNQVLVGVDVNLQDMTDGIIVERLVTCPDSCEPNSSLYNV